MGIPTVTMVTSEFEPLARLHARGRGFADLPMVLLPHPFETLPPEEVSRLADSRFGDIMSTLVDSSQRADTRGVAVKGRRWQNR